MKKTASIIITILPLFILTECKKINIENGSPQVISVDNKQVLETFSSNKINKKDDEITENNSLENEIRKPESVDNPQIISIISAIPDDPEPNETPARIKPSISTPIPTTLQTIMPTQIPTPVPTIIPTPLPIVFKPKMVLIYGGTFLMGSEGTFVESEPKPVHSVKLSNFYIGKYELKQNEYDSLTGNNPSGFKGENKPVENVTWFDAIKYCNYLSKNENIAVAYNESTGDLLDDSGDITTDITKVKGYRLPTEAEWEFAARGGNKSKGTIYSGSNLLTNVSWYRDNSENITHDVGTKEANELGLYDMSGNIWEWTTDFYQLYTSDSVVNPYISSGELRSGRGGCWGYFDGYGNVAYRGFSNPDGLSSSIGFRIARSD